MPVPSDPVWYVHAIRRSGLDIYAPLEGAQAALRIPTPVLERLLAARLVGLSFAGLPLRTRSKAAKQHVCRALGYPVPPRFKRTQPRFPGQDCNVYVQKSANLQLWNEDVARARRYVLVGLDAASAVVGVRVVTGASLLRWDTTGALTAKHQARLRLGPRPTELVTPRDTASLAPLVQGTADLDAAARPLHAPARATLWPIAHLYARLRPLVGRRFAHVGPNQERRRGARLRRWVCAQLGYRTAEDDGQFPDIPYQLVEVKLQTAPTIDLGLVRPDDREPWPGLALDGQAIRPCDVRYVLFSARTDGRTVTLTHLFVTTGAGFLARFPLLGRGPNRKTQVRLPRDFW